MPVIETWEVMTQHKLHQLRMRANTADLLDCSMASVEVIQYSSSDLYRGFFLNDALVIKAPPLMYVILGSGTAAKMFLYYYCKQFKDSDSLAALAEDHFNDVLSNLAAIVTASIAAHVRKLWWIDPIGNKFLPARLTAITFNCSCPCWATQL